MVQPVFNIISSEHTDGLIKVLLTTCADSTIFEGHFPGQPVVPGACMLQTVKEILQDKLNITIKLVKADNIKFLGLIQPGDNELSIEITYNLVEELIKVTATLFAGEQVSMKFQGSFAVV